ncbi:MAG: DNA-binding protein YbiB [Proteobacteria bacterium]|nr:DNA-binding protein YbiB [Pseudomonadota bacterium]
MTAFTAYLKEVGRGKAGARDLTRDQAGAAMSELLAGHVAPLACGAFAAAMRIKGESADELAGFLDAVQAGLAPLPQAAGMVALPSYNGARKLPCLTPLLAALLAREGIPVLVHGTPAGADRVTSFAVAAALGWPVCTDAAAVAAAWANRMPAWMPIAALHPGLAQMLAWREVIGLRNSAHIVVKLLAPQPGALRVVNHTHPEYALSTAAYLQLAGAHAMVLRGTEGEPVADARRQPQLRAFLAGQPRDDLEVPAQTGSLAALPEGLAACDAAHTAATTAAMLDGHLSVPAPIARQVQALQALRAAALQLGPALQ